MLKTKKCNNRKEFYFLGIKIGSHKINPKKANSVFTENNNIDIFDGLNCILSIVGAKYMVTPDSGWVVKTASVDALKRCIIQILNDTEKIKEMGIKARELYLKTSTKSIYKQNLLAYIKRYL